MRPPSWSLTCRGSGVKYGLKQQGVSYGAGEGLVLDPPTGRALLSTETQPLVVESGG